MKAKISPGEYPLPVKTNQIAAPEALLAAAEQAPRMFAIAGYFPALEIMRQKGYSWRQMQEWLRGFGLVISHVHLRRLYLAENIRRGSSTTAGKRDDSQTEAIRPDAPGDEGQQNDLMRYEGIT